MAAISPKPRRFTVNEYYRLGETGILAPDERVELIEGEIIEMPPIGSPHASCIARLTDLFSASLLGRVLLYVQNPIRLSNSSEPVPDVALVRRQPHGYREHHPRPADTFLVIEVSDTTLRFDQRIKVPLYAREGVPEVWVVDLTHDRVFVYREPRATGYGVTMTLRKDDVVSPAAFPEAPLAVADIL